MTEEEVDRRINEVAAKISEEYEGRQIHLICILKGGVFFTCELAKRLTVPVSLDFMSVSSYGAGTESSGVVRILKDLDEPLAGKDVLIVEDIIDSGRTLAYLIEVLKDVYKRQIYPCKENVKNILRKNLFFSSFFSPVPQKSPTPQLPVSAKSDL